MAKIRLDQLVYDLGYADSREKAKAVIMSGIVYVNGQKADKPGASFPADCDIEVRGNALPFVSRGGYKLDKALKVFPVSVRDKICIDCGASTGGFTDVLLQNGARKVYAVDVGYGQLAWKLRNDERVINLERTNLRYITREQIPEIADIAVMDVSFISIKLVLPAVTQLLSDDCDIICLIKPQFEAGRELVGKKGVVRDKKVHCSVINGILDFAPAIGLYAHHLDYSPVKGPEGNIEYICHLKKTVSDCTFDVESVVEASHQELDSERTLK